MAKKVSPVLVIGGLAAVVGLYLYAKHKQIGSVAGTGAGTTPLGPAPAAMGAAGSPVPAVTGTPAAVTSSGTGSGSGGGARSGGGFVPSPSTPASGGAATGRGTPRTSGGLTDVPAVMAGQPAGGPPPAATLSTGAPGGGGAGILPGVKPGGTIIPTLGQGGAWSIFNQGGGTLAAVAWAEQLLHKIGAPASPGNVRFLYNWQLSEGSGGKFNPLNQGPVPGQPQLTTTGQQYGGGAAGFASYQAGLKGAQAYLNMPSFQGIRNALRANNPVAAKSALIASPWAASHYGWGANFTNQPLPPIPKPRPATAPPLNVAYYHPAAAGTVARPAAYVPPGGWIPFPKIGPAARKPRRRPGTALQRFLRRPVPARRPALRSAGVASRYVSPVLYLGPARHTIHRAPARRPARPYRVATGGGLRH